MNLRSELEQIPASNELIKPRRSWMFWRRSVSFESVLKMAQLHRENCSRLALSKSFDLPNSIIAGWSGIVAAGHSAIYKPEPFQIRGVFRLLFLDVPWRLVHDRTVWLSVTLFYGLFFGMAFWCAGDSVRAEQFVGLKQIRQMEAMYQKPIGTLPDTDQGKTDSEWVGSSRNDAVMTGFYIRNNAGIGLQCFGWGIAFGLGSLYIMCSNALQLGSVFGHMATSPYWDNFSTFVTAHSVYELTAICLSAAAGLRMGYGLVETHGYGRFESVRRSAQASLPMIGTATILFILAAFIEGFISASQTPFELKLGVMLISAVSLILFASQGLREHKTI